MYVVKVHQLVFVLVLKTFFFKVQVSPVQLNLILIILFNMAPLRLTGARIFKLLRSPRMDSKELIPPAYVAWRAGTKALFLLGSYPP
jgi:hypothetical protein